MYCLVCLELLIAIPFQAALEALGKKLGRYSHRDSSTGVSTILVSSGSWLKGYCAPAERA